MQSMLPTGEFLAGLNSGVKEAATYFALASNYEPTDRGLSAFFKDRLMDKIFRAENDLVVPTSGVFEKNGGGYFPINERHIFAASDGVQHTGYFAHPFVQEKILGWLSAPS